VLKIKPKNIFFLDGIGALVSMSFLLFFGFKAADFIGLQQGLLFKLASLPMLFSVFSLTCFYVNPTKWRRYLSIIAFANIGYCGVSLDIMISHFNSLTSWGLCYFIIEKVIVVLLAIFELKMASKKPFSP
jgi:hypothetical protein